MTLKGLKMARSLRVSLRVPNQEVQMGLALPFSSSTAAYLLLPPISIHLKRLPARCVESNL